MCAVAKIASCEISFVPIGTSDYSDMIKQVLKIIEDSALETRVGDMSTFVRGDRDKVLALISRVYQSMDSLCDFTMDVRLSNLCGCKSN